VKTYATSNLSFFYLQGKSSLRSIYIYKGKMIETCCTTFGGSKMVVSNMTMKISGGGNCPVAHPCLRLEGLTQTGDHVKVL